MSAPPVDGPGSRPTPSGDGWKSDLLLAKEGKSHKMGTIAATDGAGKSAGAGDGGASSGTTAAPLQEWKVSQLQQEVCG